MSSTSAGLRPDAEAAVAAAEDTSITRAHAAMHAMIDAPGKQEMLIAQSTSINHNITPNCSLRDNLFV